MYNVIKLFTTWYIVAGCVAAHPTRTTTEAVRAVSVDSSIGHDIAERNVRCDFPGVVYNWSAMPVDIRYDDGAQMVRTVPAGGNSTQFICDADFLKVNGATLQVWDHNIGPYKNRGIVQTSSGNEFKLDAYTLRCLSVGSSATVLCFGSYNGNRY